MPRNAGHFFAELPSYGAGFTFRTLKRPSAKFHLAVSLNLKFTQV
jgi:hypothetical protein